MTNFFGSGPLPEWKEIREMLGKDIPWHLVDKWDRARDGDWMDRLIGRLAQEHRQEPAPTPAHSLLKIETVKQAKKLLVTFQLPGSVNMQNLRMYAVTDRLRIAGLPEGRTQSVHFPCPVYPKTGKAALHDRKMLIEFRRRPADQDEVELFIQP